MFKIRVHYEVEGGQSKKSTDVGNLNLYLIINEMCNRQNKTFILNA